MPKQKTPEERKAWGEKMKAARIKKAQEAQDSVNQADEGLKDSSPPQPTPEPDQAGSEDLAQLRQLVKELASELHTLKGGSQTLSPRGIVGTYEKFSTTASYYPNPLDRLFDYMESTPQLRRFGFRDNYEMSWNVTPTRYQTIDGVWTSEPRFNVELIGIIYDENTYEKTDKRYIVRRLTFHEDPDAAVFVAQQNGVEVDEENPREFLDEMRYLRVRQWLRDTFFPQKFLPERSDTKDEVIGNVLRTTFHVGSSTTAKTFDDIKKG